MEPTTTPTLASTAPAAPVPAPAPALTWTARTILQWGTRIVRTPTGKAKVVRGVTQREPVLLVDFVHDRAELFTPGGTPVEVRNAFIGLLDEVLAAVRAEVAKAGSENAIPTTLRACGLQVTLRPSGGYLYITARLPTSAETEIMAAKWSGRNPIPAPGDRVAVRMNGFGPGLVLSRAVEHGYAALIVLPDTQPEWHREQCGGTSVIWVFGAELA